MIYARHLGLIEESDVFAQHRTQRQREDDDPDATLPLHDRAPEEDPLREMLHRSKGRGARSGKARDRLKERITKAWQIASHEEGDHTDQCHHQPRHRYGEHSLTTPEFVTMLQPSTEE